MDELEEAAKSTRKARAAAPQRRAGGCGCVGWGISRHRPAPAGRRRPAHLVPAPLRAAPADRGRHGLRAAGRRDQEPRGRPRPVRPAQRRLAPAGDRRRRPVWAGASGRAAGRAAGSTAGPTAGRITGRHDRHGCGRRRGTLRSTHLGRTGTGRRGLRSRRTRAGRPRRPRLRRRRRLPTGGRQAKKGWSERRREKRRSLELELVATELSPPLMALVCVCSDGSQPSMPQTMLRSNAHTTSG